MDTPSAHDNYQRMRADMVSFAETAQLTDSVAKLFENDEEQIDVHQIQEDFKTLFTKDNSLSSNENIVVMSAMNEVGVDALKGWLYEKLLLGDRKESRGEVEDAWDLRHDTS